MPANMLNILHHVRFGLKQVASASVSSHEPRINIAIGVAVRSAIAGGLSSPLADT
jgi:hypothetical protein